MAKTSLIAIIWVWHCVAYGQLSVDYNPYYIPYISTFVTQPHCHQNYDETVDQIVERNYPFPGALFLKIRKLEAIAANLAKQLKDTTAKLEKNISDLKDELNAKVTKDDLAKKADQSKLDETNTELKTTSNNLATTRTELSSTKSDVEDLTIKLNAMSTSEIVDIGGMPTSCSDLQRMGHKFSGFFSVKGSVKMEMIYCNFNPNQIEKQKWIGYTDVKSAPVHFYVQRSTNFNTTGTPIPWDVARVNEGNAMNLTSGIFTAPATGIYFFSFTGMGRVEETNTVAGQWSPLTLQSTLNLKKGDQVWLQIGGRSTETYLYDSIYHFTHFTGFMLEEEIVASL